MVRNPLAEIRFDFHFGLPFSLGWIMLLALLVAGCAMPQPRPQVQTFPNFVAVTAQTGDTFSSLASKYLNDPSMDWVISEFNDVTSLSPGQALIIPLKPYNKGGLTFKGYQTVPVLTYHKFSKNSADAMTVTESAFEEQMRFLKQNGYRVISMDNFFDFLDFKRQIPEKSVVITIDDGWRSTYDVAFPILKKYGYPAALFVYTDLINLNEKTLDWDLIREMAKNGIDIQCHTKTHRNLDTRGSHESFREYFEAVKKELTESAQVIKRRLNIDPKYLAYPYGDTNHLVVALLVKLGYRGAFTVEREGNPFFVHHYRINRSMIYGYFDLQDFEKNLTTFSH
jgi:peptidoglycan/xylan/chitin deacetylase (PgdA/CDA1 family)